MSSEPRIFKRASVRDPRGGLWTIVVEDRLDPAVAEVARDTAEAFGRYAMTIYAPNGRSTEALLAANTRQVDNEFNRYRQEIASGAWGAELLREIAETSG